MLLAVFSSGTNLIKLQEVKIRLLVWILTLRSSVICPLSVGTKLHQATRKAISKQKPALMHVIWKFNQYCAQLEEMFQPEWAIPLPEPLPTQLALLCECNHLIEDVWISRSEGQVPRWLEDIDVRKGIRCMLKADRCLEERH